MYPNNPNLLEKLVWTKVDEIQREVQNANQRPIELGPKSKMLAITGLLIVLAWFSSVVL